MENGRSSLTEEQGDSQQKWTMTKMKSEKDFCFFHTACC